ncbi:serine/threonine-protein kinase [Myxococcus stipitatus]|uniref:serine/threonine protein kinase n=1 Tax=Myxococcus stipitatus TaxID=83455 RepID=UPI0030D149A7
MLAFGAMRVMEPTPFGKYTLLKTVICDGASVGYRARTTSESGAESMVFVRQPYSHMLRYPEFVAGYLDDARIAMRFGHANLIRGLDFGQVQDTPYVVTEWVDGEALCRVLWAARRKGRKGFPAPVAVSIASEIARALHATHLLRDEHDVPLGLVRREIYSGSVFLSFNGEVKVDALGWHRKEHPAWSAGVLRGKVMYFSPEQARGRPLDGRSDVYVLGLLLFQMLCGEIANNGEHDHARIMQVSEGRLQSARALNPSLDPSLVEILEKALSVSPDDRYPSAEAFALALDEWRCSVDSEDPSDARRALMAEFHPERVEVRLPRPPIRPPEAPSLVERIKRWVLPGRAR